MRNIMDKPPINSASRARWAKRYGRGYSLIELGIVLGVITGLVVGVLFLAQSVTTKQRNTQMVRESIRVVAVALEQFNIGGTIASSADLVPLIEATGEVPSSRFTGTLSSTDRGKLSFFPSTGTVNTIKFPGGVRVAVTASATSNRSNYAFAVGFLDFNKATCIALAEALLQGRDGLFQFIYYKATAGNKNNVGAGLATAASPVNIAGTNACGGELPGAIIALYR